MAQKLWRFRVYETDESTVSFSITNDQLVAAPTIPSPRAQVLDGKIENVSFQIEVGDFSAFLSNKLADADDRMDLQGRLVEAQIDTGSGFATVWEGRWAGSFEADGPGKYFVRLANEHWKVRNTDIFTTTDTVVIQPTEPHGLKDDWGGGSGRSYRAANGMTCTVEDTDSEVGFYNYVKLSVDVTPIPEKVVEFVIQDLKSEAIFKDNLTSGNFNSLRLEIGSENYEIIGFSTYTPSAVNAGDGSTRKEYLLGSLYEEDNPTWPLFVWIDWGGINPLPAVVDSFVGRFVFDGLPTTEATPFHIGGLNGVDPIAYLKTLYDDNGIRYESDAFSQYDPSTNPNGLVGHPRVRNMWWRITEPKKLGPWSEEAIYKPLGLVPFLNESGEIAPRSVFLPQDVDPTTLTAITPDNVAEHPTWEHGGTESVTQIRVVPQLGRPDPAEPVDAEALDRIVVQDSPLPTYSHDKENVVGSRVHEIRYDGIWNKVIAGRFVEPIVTELFDRFGDGPQRGEFKGLQTLDSVKVGDFVVIEVDNFPNASGANGRGGSRVVQIIGKQFTPEGPDFEFLDAGPANQPLSTPTVSISQVTNVRTQVSVSISNLDADAVKWILEIRVNSGDWNRYGEFDVATTSVTIGGFPEDATIEARAFVTAPNQIRSGYSSVDSVTLGGLTAPSGLSATVIGRSISLTWTNGEDDIPVMPFIYTEDDNLLADPEDFSGGDWTGWNGGTVDTDVIRAPNGTLTADRINVPSGTLGSDGGFYQNLSLDTSIQRVLSAYVKADTHTVATLLMDYNGGTQDLQYTDFDLSAGTLLSGGRAEGSNAGIENIGDGWYRIWMTGTDGNGDNTAMRSVFITDEPGTGTNSIFAWGVQLEVGTEPSSYGTDASNNPLPFGTTEFVFSGLEASKDYTLGVYHFNPETGGVSAKTTTTATTGTANALNAPKRLVVLQGRNSNTASELPPEELSVGEGLEVGWELGQPHAYTFIQAATDSGFSNVVYETKTESGVTKKLIKGLDLGTTYFVRIKHERFGFTDSAWTTTVSAQATRLLPEGAKQDLFAAGSARLYVENGILKVHIDTNDQDTDRVYFEAVKNPGANPYPTVDTSDNEVTRANLPYDSFALDSGGSQISMDDGDVAYVTVGFYNDVAGFGSFVFDTIAVTPQEIVIHITTTQVVAEEDGGTTVDIDSDSFGDKDILDPHLQYDVQVDIYDARNEGGTLYVYTNPEGEGDSTPPLDGTDPTIGAAYDGTASSGTTPASFTKSETSALGNVLVSMFRKKQMGVVWVSDDGRQRASTFSLGEDRGERTAVGGWLRQFLVDEFGLDPNYGGGHRGLTLEEFEQEWIAGFLGNRVLTPSEIASTDGLTTLMDGEGKSIKNVLMEDTVTDSGARQISLFLAKPTTGDPDDLDGVDDGTVYKRVISVDSNGKVTAASINVGTLSAISANIGTVTAGTIEANIIIAAGSFTAANPVFDGNLFVKGETGSNLLLLTSSGNGGRIFWRNSAGSDRGDIQIDGNEDVHLTAFNEFRITADNVQLNPAGRLMLNETSNAKMTVGLTLNQGTNDNEIVSLKSSDVAHGMTTETETDTYARIQKYLGSLGGVLLTGLTEGGQGIGLQGMATSGSTTKNTSTVGNIPLLAYKKSGTSVGSMGSNENLITFHSGATTRFIFDNEGDAHADVQWTTFDEYDDLVVLENLEALLAPDQVKRAFGDVMDYDQEFFEDLGLFHDIREVGPGKMRGMMNQTRMLMFHSGAIRQVGRMVMQVMEENKQLRFQVENLEKRLTN